MDYEIKYAKSGQLNIAYQVIGEGEETLIVINGWISNLEEGWNLPGLPEWLIALSAFCKLIIFDKRGTGLSDRVDEKDLPVLTQRMEDLKAIMTHEKIPRASLLGFSEGGPMALLFAATYPEKIKSLIIYGSYACWTQKPGYSIGLPREIHEKSIEMIDRHWGQAIGLHLMGPSVCENKNYQNAWASFLRKSASPNTAIALYRMNSAIDIRDILPKVKVPVLVLHRHGDKLISPELGKYIADHVAGAKWVLLPGSDHFPWLGNRHDVVHAIRQFMGLGKSLPDEFVPPAVNRDDMVAKMALKTKKLTVEDLDKLFEIKEYLTVNYLENPSISEISKNFGINTFKLKLGFKYLFKLPVKQFLLELRLKHAYRLIQETEKSVTEVATIAGYQQTANFSKAFRQKFGKNPNAIRRN